MQNNSENAEIIRKLEDEIETLNIKLKHLQNDYNIMKEESETNAQQYFIILSEIQESERERRQLEEKLRQSQKMEAIGLLAGGIAHDFNNLLTVIQGYSEVAYSLVEPNTPLAKNIQSIIKAGDKAKALTQQLLTFSRKQIIKPEIININDTIFELNDVLNTICGDTVYLSIDVDNELYNIRADQGQIHQILMNLVINAKDAIPSNGKITICTENRFYNEQQGVEPDIIKPGIYVALIIQDTGTGMDDEVKNRMFDPFFTTKDVGKGTGLGLPTVYGIIKQIGGVIQVDSTLGKGTTFAIIIPATEEETSRKMIEHVETETTLGNEVILVVEDESDVRELICDTLLMNEYSVLDAANGFEGLRVYEENKDKIDLIISDLIMPELSGEEMINKIKEDNENISVLYMSGYTDDMISNEGILNEGVYFIQKPFRLKKFISKVRSILDRIKDKEL